MIYLLNTSMLVIKDAKDIKKNETISILKIGYSRDDRGEGRFNDYTSNGLIICPVKTIPGGSLKLEGELQKKYESHNIPGRSREWFYMSDEILDDFSKCDSETDLYRLLGVENEEELVKRERESFGARKLYTLEIQEGFDRFKQDHPDKLESNTYHLLEEFRDLFAFPERMKLVCNNSEDSLFLQYIPEPFITFLTFLGPDTCKSFSYLRYRLEEEYRKRTNNQDLDVTGRILETFQVGTKHTISEIRELLGIIYQDSGLIKTPKATDLLEYFDIKEAKLTVDRGKREGGYLILGIKSL